MSNDDFDVIVYTVLAYILACAKAGVVPSITKAQEVAQCNDVYWSMVIRSMLTDGYITGASVDSYIDGSVDISSGAELSITQKGAKYLKDNNRMKAVKAFLGSAFEQVLPIAVEATKALMI